MIAGTLPEFSPNVSFYLLILCFNNVVVVSVKPFKIPYIGFDLAVIAMIPLLAILYLTLCLVVLVSACFPQRGYRGVPKPEIIICLKCFVDKMDENPIGTTRAFPVQVHEPG
jgi:hypothetical protein